MDATWNDVDVDVRDAMLKKCAGAAPKAKHRGSWFVDRADRYVSSKQLNLYRIAYGI